MHMHILSVKKHMLHGFSHRHISYVWSQIAAEAADKRGARPVFLGFLAYAGLFPPGAAYRRLGRRHTETERERERRREYEAVKRKVRVERDLRESMHYLLVHSSLLHLLLLLFLCSLLPLFLCSLFLFIFSSSLSCTLSTSQSSTPSCSTASSRSLSIFFLLFSSSSFTPSWSSSTFSSFYLPNPPFCLWLHLLCVFLIKVAIPHCGNTVRRNSHAFKMLRK